MHICAHFYDRMSHVHNFTEECNVLRDIAPLEIPWCTVSVSVQFFFRVQ